MNFKNIFIASLLSIVMIFSSFVAFASDENNAVIKLTVGSAEMTVNGETAEIDPGRGTAPVIRDGRTLVPIRSIIEAMGGTVEWVAEESKVILKLKDDEISLKIDSVSAFFNGTESTLDVAPAIINDRTMLPIRYIAESFNFDVVWEGVTNIITITKKSEADNPDADAVKNEENSEFIDEDIYADNFYDEIMEEDYWNSYYFEEEDFYDDFYEEDFYDEFYEDEFFEDEFFEDEFFE